MGRKPDDYRQQHKKNVRSTSYCNSFQNSRNAVPRRLRRKTAKSFGQQFGPGQKEDSYGK